MSTRRPQEFPETASVCCGGGAGSLSSPFGLQFLVGAGVGFAVSAGVGAGVGFVVGSPVGQRNSLRAFCTRFSRYTQPSRGTAGYWCPIYRQSTGVVRIGFRSVHKTKSAVLCTLNRQCISCRGTINCTQSVCTAFISRSPAGEKELGSWSVWASIRGDWLG